MKICFFMKFNYYSIVGAKLARIEYETWLDVISDVLSAKD